MVGVVVPGVATVGAVVVGMVAAGVARLVWETPTFHASECGESLRRSYEREYKSIDDLLDEIDGGASEGL
jgi:hypothetical protein